MQNTADPLSFFRPYVRVHALLRSVLSDTSANSPPTCSMRVSQKQNDEQRWVQTPKQHRRWQQNWQFPTKKAIDSALQLASALSYLHGRAIEGSFVVHRDLKPENIAFSSDGRLKLFGKRVRATQQQQQQRQLQRDRRGRKG